MKSNHTRLFICLTLALLTTPSPSTRLLAQAPWPWAPAASTTPAAQRAAMGNVRSQAGWLQNATRTAPNYATGGDGMVMQQFQRLRGSYNAFTATLNQRQLSNGANEWAELSSGLDIIQQSFANYNDDIASGRSPSLALADLCSILGRATGVWLQEFNKDCSRLRVGL